MGSEHGYLTEAIYEREMSTKRPAMIGERPIETIERAIGTCKISAKNESAQNI